MHRVQVMFTGSSRDVKFLLPILEGYALVLLYTVDLKGFS